MRARILSYSAYSASASSLSEHSGIKRVRKDSSRSRFIGTDQDVIINWGSSYTPEHLAQSVFINDPSSVRAASSKLQAFRLFAENDISIPKFTDSPQEATGWLRDGKTVVGRALTRGSSGRGIHLLSAETNREEAIPQFPLYTMYIPKQFEYRVHVLPCGKTLIRQKRRNLSVPGDSVDWRIRTHRNGFVFTQSISGPTDGLASLATDAVRALNLQFGAVDIIYNQKRDRFYVLEVNTAPGLEGSTISEYSESFQRVIGGQQ